MYSGVQVYLFHIGPYLIILHRVREDEICDILKYFHDEPCSGKFADKRIVHKVIHLGYYWPIIFRDAKNYMRSCESCQRMGQPI
jgi:hypothetical protein